MNDIFHPDKYFASGPRQEAKVKEEEEKSFHINTNTERIKSYTENRNKDWIQSHFKYSGLNTVIVAVHWTNFLGSFIQPC